MYSTLTEHIGPEPDGAHALPVTFKNLDAPQLVGADFGQQADLILVDIEYLVWRAFDLHLLVKPVKLSHLDSVILPKEDASTELEFCLKMHIKPGIV